MNSIFTKIEQMSVKQLMVVALILALVIVAWQNRDLIQSKIEPIK
jgi:hypothetical protein